MRQHEQSRKTSLRRWMLIAGVAAATLAGGLAYARTSLCKDCTACGCGVEGGVIMCCTFLNC